MSVEYSCSKNLGKKGLEMGKHRACVRSTKQVNWVNTMDYERVAGGHME